MDRSLPDKMKSGKKNGASRLIKEGALRRFVTTPARSNKSSNNLLSEAKIRFVYLPMGGGETFLALGDPEQAKAAGQS